MLLEQSSPITPLVLSISKFARLTFFLYFALTLIVDCHYNIKFSHLFFILAEIRKKSQFSYTICQLLLFPDNIDLRLITIVPTKSDSDVYFVYNF